jgi:hypothetical protein
MPVATGATADAADPRDGNFEVAVGDVITITYGLIEATATIATIQIKVTPTEVGEWFAIGDSPLVEVDERSHTSGIDTIEVLVSSTTDTDGETITLTETADTSGLYRGSFTLSSATPAAGEVQVAEDAAEQITAAFGKVVDTAWSDDVEPVSTIVEPNTDLTVSAYTIRGNAQDTNSGLTKVELSLDGGSHWTTVLITTATDVEMSWSYAWEIAADGTYEIMSRAIDAVGVVQAIPDDPAFGTNYIEVLVDSTAPVISNAASSFTVLDHPMEPVISATVADAVSGVDTVVVDASAIDSGATAVAMTDPDGDGVYETEAGAIVVDDGLDAGLKTLTITATDVLGNASTADIEVEIVDDTTEPVLSDGQVIYPTGGIAAETGHDVILRVTATDDLTGIASVDVDFATGDAADLFDVGAINLAQVDTNVYESAPTEVTATLPADVTEADYTVNVLATDGAGNQSAALALTVTLVEEVNTRYYALADGWNYISVPMAVVETSLEAAFADAPEVTEIYTWLGGTQMAAHRLDDGTWDNPDGIEIVPGMGYIVRAEGDTSITLTYAPVEYAAPPVASITLYQGWNLFGPTFPSITAATVGQDAGQVMATAYGQWSVMYRQVAGVWTPVRPDYPPNLFPASFTMVGGEAYWIYVTAPILTLV